MDLESLARHIAESLPVPLRREAMSYLDGGIPRAWLRERIDADSPLITERLRANIQPGDEPWRFRSSEHSWRTLAGREGVAIVRAGVVVYSECYMVS